MKYFKLEDINGLSFRHHRTSSNPLIYTINVDKEQNGCTVSWVDEFQKLHDSSWYRIPDALLLLNQGKWIPVNNTENYEIF